MSVGQRMALQLPGSMCVPVGLLLVLQNAGVRWLRVCHNACVLMGLVLRRRCCRLPAPGLVGQPLGQWEKFLYVSACCWQLQQGMVPLQAPQFCQCCAVCQGTEVAQFMLLHQAAHNHLYQDISRFASVRE